MKTIISFDFDSTLTQEKIQQVAVALIKRNFEVWIVTSRFDNLHRLPYKDLKPNTDVFALAEKLGILPHRIGFTNQQPKWILLNNSGIQVHVDDDLGELKSLAYYGIVKGFNCNSERFKEDLENYIESIENF